MVSVWSSWTSRVKSYSLKARFLVVITRVRFGFPSSRTCTSFLNRFRLLPRSSSSAGFAGAAPAACRGTIAGGREGGALDSGRTARGPPRSSSGDSSGRRPRPGRRGTILRYERGRRDGGAFEDLCRFVLLLRLYRGSFRRLFQNFRALHRRGLRFFGERNGLGLRPGIPGLSPPPGEVRARPRVCFLQPSSLPVSLRPQGARRERRPGFDGGGTSSGRLGRSFLLGLNDSSFPKVSAAGGASSLRGASGAGAFFLRRLLGGGLGGCRRGRFRSRREPPPF